MRTLAIISISIIAAAAIAMTSCENVFNDAIDQYAADTVYMFATASTYYGNLGGREGADAICQSIYDASYGNLEVKNVRAFINMTSEDQIRNMPENFGVPDNAAIVGPTGTIIDNSWEELLDGAIQNTLQAAGVFSSAPWYYWTGDNGTGNGVIDPALHCTGWKTTDVSGRLGDYSSKTTTWIGSGTGFCFNKYHLLCIAW